MRTKRLTTVALAALPLTAVLGSGNALAQWRVVEPQRQQQIRYGEMDVNGDGVVTRREWTGTRRAFNQADWNGDGVLSGDELRVDDDQAVGTSGTVDRRSEFLRFDENDDGILNRREWSGLRSTFDSLDTNDDGVVTQREYVANTAAATPARRPGVTARGAQQTVFVDAQVRWTATGIYVSQGDALVFDSRGIVQMSADPGDTAITAGAYSQRRANDAPLPHALAGALIGRIGNGAPFGIGDQRQITAPASGELFLAVNDDHLEDNRGGFRVQVGVH